MYLHFNDSIVINAAASKVWQVLAHEFGTIGQWASSIPTSHVVPELPAPPGAEAGARVCATAVPGFGAVQETFTSYDEPAMRFAYEATQGLPWFITHAENHWMVRSLGTASCEVEARAQVEVRLFPGVFLAPLMKVQLGRTGRRLFEELKYYVEQDQPHPRKVKAQAQQGQKVSHLMGRPGE
jgi:hypothetical protein